jgi:hypothetical protein
MCEHSICSYLSQHQRLLLPSVRKTGFTGELDAASGGEAAFDNGLAGFADFDEVVQHSVDDDFVEGGLIPIGGEVKLEAFRLHAELVRNVAYLQMCAVWLASHRTQAAELRRVQMNGVVPLWRAIGEDVENVSAWLRRQAVL